MAYIGILSNTQAVLLTIFLCNGGNLFPHPIDKYSKDKLLGDLRNLVLH